MPQDAPFEKFSVAFADGALCGRRIVNRSAPPLLFCHATGFCASAYKKMLLELSAHFDIYALDMRGHGSTTLPAHASGLRSWGVFADDVVAFLKERNDTDWTLAGHSMGAVAVTMAAAALDDARKKIAALRLIEPVAVSPFYVLLARTSIWSVIGPRISLAKRAANRRSYWPSRDAAHASYERKALFRNWASGALDDYLTDGLTADGEGVRLSCDPAWEAATFAAQANDFWGAVRNAPARIGVLAADDASSTVWPAARRRFSRFGAHVALTPDIGHLAPMESPESVAAFVRDGL